MRLVDTAWSDTLCIDITSLDNEHKVLAQKFELLKLCSNTHEPTKTLLELFDDLISSLQIHFTHEELIFKNISYPDLAQHAIIHASILTKIIKYREVFSESPTEDNLEKTLLFLDTSIAGHLFIEDGKVRDYIHRTE